MEEACSTAWGKARLCRVTRRCHDATLTRPSHQLLMPTWKVAHLMCSDGGREASHSHRSATVRPGTARFLTRAPLVDILTSSTRLMIESPSRSVLQSGGTLCCCIRWRGEGRGSVTVLCWRGAALACQWGLSVVAGGRGEEGWGRWRGEGWCDGFQVCTVCQGCVAVVY